MDYFTASPRPIEQIISDHLETRYIRIEVSDTGTGIAPEDQEAVFTRFFRVENRVHTLEGLDWDYRLSAILLINIIAKFT
jgi:signal transduction histidine kinase